MDWDKLKVFHAAAEAGSLHPCGRAARPVAIGGVAPGVRARAGDLSVSLFHRHARGLILTEQGELLYRTAHEVFMKLEAARAKLTDSRERPNGELKVTTTPGLGVHWLTPRLGEFLDLYPDIQITLITTDEELDLAMREADVAIRLRQPTQPDLIQRKIVLGAFPRLRLARLSQAFRHAARARRPRQAPHHSARRLRCRPISPAGACCLKSGATAKSPRVPLLTINNVLGLVRACQRGLGVAMLPDYLVEENGGLVQLFGEADTLALDAYFVYPEELKSVARVQVFRDFLVANAQRWNF